MHKNIIDLHYYCLCSELRKYMKVYIIRPKYMHLLVTQSQILKTLIFKPWHVLPAVQVFMWFKTFFIVRQWGKLQGFTAPF